jgi:hypothetical protein
VIFYYALPKKLEDKVKREQFYMTSRVNETKRLAVIEKELSIYKATRQYTNMTNKLI